MDQPAFGGPIGTRVDRRSALHQEFDRYTAGCDPAMGAVHVEAIAIADRSVMNHQTAVASPRAGPEMIEVAAFVVNDRRHTNPPQSYEEEFCHAAVTKSIGRGHRCAARLHGGLSGDRASSPHVRSRLVGPLRALVVSNEVASDGMTTAQLAGLRYTNDPRRPWPRC